MAAALLERLLEEEGISECCVSSAGTIATPNLPATEAAISAATRMMLDIGRHRSRQVGREMLESSDLVLCMTGDHREALTQMAPSAEERIVLLGSLAAGDAAEEEIEDPIGAGPEVHYQCLRKMERHLRQLVKRLKESAP